MTYKKNSLSKHLQSVQKHFKISSESTKIDNAIVDIGFGFSFSQRSIFTQLPAGQYFVSATRNDDFILAKSSKKTIVSTDHELQDLIDALTEFDDTSNYDSNQIKEQLIHEQANSYLNVGYFPLHEYNEGLKVAYNDLITFLNNIDFYSENELGFKRSQLFFGLHGTGKSRYIDWITKELIKHLDAIVIRINSVSEIERILSDGILILNELTKKRLVVFVIEELAQIVNLAGHIALLHFLDNNLLRDNVIFFSTTNTPERIPANIIARYQRIDQIIEVSSKDNGEEFIAEFYKFVFNEELPVKYKHSDWYSDDLTPAALKELFVYSKMRGVDLNEAYIRVLEREKIVKNRFDTSNPIGFHFA